MFCLPRSTGPLAAAALFACIAVGCTQEKHEDSDHAAAPLAGVEVHAAADAAEGEVIMVNSYCPLGKEPVVAEVGTVSYNGHNVGFCCGGCKEMWDSMPDAERDAFIAAAVAGTEDRVGG